MIKLIGLFRLVKQIELKPRIIRMKMRDNYNFANARKNPYAEKMKRGYSVTVHCGPSDGKLSRDAADVTVRYELTPDEAAIIERHRSSKRS